MLNWILEKYLHWYKTVDRENLLQTYGETFYDQEDAIIQLLKQTELYHGTGAYHYHYPNGSKYSEGKPEVTYSLQTILKSGLIPQEDLFNTTFNTGASETLSFTTNRIYARGYSQLFFTEGTGLEYTYGPLNFWFFPIGKRIFFGVLKHNLSKGVSYFYSPESKLARKRYQETMIRWSRSYREDGKYEDTSLVKCMNGRSDILSNFGFVIGIKRGVVTPLDIKYPNISKDEVRTQQPIHPNHFSHIQVPLRFVEQVKKECKFLSVNIPIIPLEFVELHNHKVGLRNLIALTKRKGVR